MSQSVSPRPTRANKRSLCFFPPCLPSNHVRSYHSVLSSNEKRCDSNFKLAALVPSSSTSPNRPSTLFPLRFYTTFSHVIFSLSLLCKSKCSIGLIFLVFFQLLQVSCTAAACDCSMMMIVLLILRPGHSSVLFTVAVRVLPQCLGMYILDCFAALPVGALLFCLALDSYVIPSNNLSLLSRLDSYLPGIVDIVLSSICFRGQ